MRDTLDAREPWDEMLEIGDSGAGDVAVAACALLSGVSIILADSPRPARVKTRTGTL